MQKSAVLINTALYQQVLLLLQLMSNDIESTTAALTISRGAAGPSLKYTATFW
jgi:hypothetical protein